jgi:hypothetical protein
MKTFQNHGTDRQKEATLQGKCLIEFVNFFPAKSVMFERGRAVSSVCLR